MSTWEDLEYLRQQFPRAALWGHPGAQRGGGVRNDTPAAMPDDEQEASASGAAAGRPERAKTESAKMYGPEWENE